MILICKIELPNDASDIQIFDAMAKAARDESMWEKHYTKEDRLKKTNLEGKCGSCEHFRPYESASLKSCGGCAKGRQWRQRTSTCSLYERAKNETLRN